MGWANSRTKGKLSTKVYGMGEGWTGALGTGSILSYQNVERRNDFVNRMMLDEEEMDSHYLASNGLIEILLENESKVKNLAVGWGHSVIQLEDAGEDNCDVYISGRPHDFQTLLRLKRLPVWVRDNLIRVSESIFPEPPQSTGAKCFYKTFTKFNFIQNCTDIHASAGLTAFLCEGKVYCMGINTHGQCGNGCYDSSNVYIPNVSVRGITPRRTTQARSTVESTVSVRSLALGLQHAIAIDENGTVYTWGKAARGQLGNFDWEHESPIYNFRVNADFLDDLPPAKKADAGFHHCALLGSDGCVYIWGRNMLLSLENKPVDAVTPRKLLGLPPLQIKDITCGSHHTSVLMEDGSVYCHGITTDNTQLLPQAVQILPPNSSQVIQFTSGFDRTIILYPEQVFEIKLWSHDDLRHNAHYIPIWFRDLRARGENVTMIQRGWLHSLIVTQT